MADNSKDSLIFKFLANITGLQEGAEQAAKTVDNAVGGMRSTIKGLEGAFGGVMAGFAAVTAIIGGGAVIGKFVEDFAHGTQEAISLGRALGTTATEASYLQQALQQANVSQGAATIAARRLAMDASSGGDAIKRLGVDLKNADGSMKDSVTLMLEVNEKLRGFREGTDRNVEGIRIYGRAWNEIAPMVERMSKDGIANLRKETDSLNLTVTKEGVAAAEAYRLAQNDVGDAMEGVKRTIGQALMPGLTEMGQWFASQGPAAVEVTKVVMNHVVVLLETVGTVAKAAWGILSDGAAMVGTVIRSVFAPGSESMSALEFFTNVLRIVQAAFISLRIGFELVAEVIRMGLQRLTVWFETFRDVAKAALSLDFSAAKGAWEKGTAEAEAVVQRSVARMVAIAEKGKADLDKALTGDPTAAFKGTAVTKSTEGKDAGEDPNKKKPKEEKDNRLSEWRAELQQHYELTKNYLDKELDYELQYWTAKLAAVRGNTEKDKQLRQSIEQELFNIRRQLAQQERQLEDQSIDQRKRMGEAAIAVKRQDADAQVKLGEMTALQRLTLEQQFQEQSFQLELEALQAKATLHQANVVQHAKYLNEIAVLEAKHRGDQRKLDQQAAIERRQVIQSSLSPMLNAFNNVVTGIQQGTTRMRDVFRNALQGMLLEFVNNFCKKMVTEWLTTQAQKLAASNSFFAQLLGLEAASAAQTVVTKKATAAATVPADAASAASGAASSVASIPYVGPILAAAAFASTMAMVMGAMNGFAVGSWEVPGDMFTKIHKGEMIVPAQFAENIRENGIAGKGDGNVTIKGAPLPGGFFAVHRDELVKALKGARRDHAF